MTDTTDRRYYVVSPDERAIYEFPPTTTAAQADAWLTTRQDDDRLPWNAVLMWDTEAAAYDTLAGLIDLIEHAHDRWNA